MSSSEALSKLNAQLKILLAGRQQIDILEAGGGSNMRLELDPSIKAVITTIDISDVQLAENTYAAHKIKGDLCSYKYDPASYDLIVCYDVLEHLEDPEAAVRAFIPALRPGGLIVIGSPNPKSFKGLVTKFTPHSVHAAFYRVFHNNPNAGKPGYFPYPTTLRFFMAPNSLSRFFAHEGLSLRFIDIYDSGIANVIAAKSAVLGHVFKAVMGMAKTLGGKKMQLDGSDFHLLVQR